MEVQRQVARRVDEGVVDKVYIWMAGVENNKMGLWQH